MVDEALLKLGPGAGEGHVVVQSSGATQRVKRSSLTEAGPREWDARMDQDNFDPRTPGNRALRAAGENAADLMQTRSELLARIDKLESLVGFLTARLLSGEGFKANDEPVLRFFGISNKNPDPMKMIRARSQARAGKILGVVECPSCGSNVQDLEGVTEETCGFCGAKVTTDA